MVRSKMLGLTSGGMCWFLPGDSGWMNQVHHPKRTESVMRFVNDKKSQEGRQDSIHTQGLLGETSLRIPEMAFIKGYINDPSCKPFTNLRDSPSIALCVLAVHVSVSQHVPTEESFMFVLKCFEEPPTCLVLLGFPKKIRKDHSIKYLFLPSRSRIP